MTTCMHAKAHEEFFFFYATCRSATSWEVPVLNQCTSDKKMLILSYISLVSLCLFSMLPALASDRLTSACQCQTARLARTQKCQTASNVVGAKILRSLQGFAVTRHSRFFT